MGSVDRGIPGHSTTTAAVTPQDSPGDPSVGAEQQPGKPPITPCRPLTASFHYPKYALKYGGHVKDIEWNFDTGYGIVDYTRVFINAHENRGVAVTRDTVEKFWVEAVKTQFKDSKRERFFYLRQVRAGGTRS